MSGDAYELLKPSRPGADSDLQPQLLSELFEHSTDAILLLDRSEQVIKANPRAAVLLGARGDALLGLGLTELLPVGSPLLAFLGSDDREDPLRIEVELARIDGGFVTVEAVARRLTDGHTLLICRDTTLRYTAERALAGTERRFRAMVQNSSDITVVLDGLGAVTYVSPAADRLGVGRGGLSQDQLMRAVHPRDRETARNLLKELLRRGAASAKRASRQARAAKPSLGRSVDKLNGAPGAVMPISDHELELEEEPAVATVRFRVTGAWRWFEVEGTDLRHDPDVRGIVLNARDVTDRVTTENRLRTSEAYYRAIFEKSFEGVLMLDENRKVVSLSGAAERILGHPFATFAGQDRSDLIHEDDRDAFFDVLDMAEAVPGASESVRYRFRDAAGAWHWLEGSVTNLLHDPDLRAFVINFRDISDRVRSMEKIQDLNAELRRRLIHLQSLRRIDMAITNSADVRLILDIFMDQFVQDLGVDAVAILLYEPSIQALRPASAKGFTGEIRLGSRTSLGEGPAGRAALEQRAVYLHDLHGEESRGAAVDPTMQEEFSSYMAVPMLAKGQLQGVIELYARKPFESSDEWLEFLETYADQGAIAIENAQLFRSLERSNVELQRAYDRTIEGWANALDLKDEETAGHSKRVTEMTVRMARKLGISAEDVVHVQRGALLHDIGKMGIPDDILLKRGPLTAEEFAVMKEHPIYAYELLSPIEFLRPALDIPYCHHERWDGTGYPRGLRGEQIPLSARIFAVVDVFDALTSDRPYRSAWSKEEAEAHIRAGAGTHFDPAVIATFFEVSHEES